MGPKLFIAIRWIALAILIIAVIMIILRWKYPQEMEKGEGFLAFARRKYSVWKNNRLHARSEAKKVAALRGRKILIADPDEKSARILNWKLNSLGCTTMNAKNGAKAAELTSAEKPDVIVADALLPDVSAGEFFASLGERKPPVIFVGTLANQMGELRKLGAAACLPKPFDPDSVASIAGAIILYNTNRTPI